MTRALLALHAATRFRLTQGRRIAGENDPDGAIAPRLYMSGCEEGWIGYLREDFDEAAARAFDELVLREPPVRAPGAVPRFADAYREIVDTDELLTAHNYGPIHRLPRGTPWPGEATIVRSGTSDGAALRARLQSEGMPQGMIDVGFADPSHLWEPWCAVLVEGEVASVAFAARKGLLAADVGVFTLEAYRGRGLAGAVTAAWSTLLPRHPVLFYSTHRDNAASQRVIAKLGLPFVGESLTI
ncbi:MAG: hypothetical protein WDM86_11885 [Rhizomicrobium sp.]